MLTKEMLGYKIVFLPVPNGYSVTVSDNRKSKTIPLLPDEGQVTRAIDSLDRMPIDPNIAFDFFCMIVAGCLMTKMKRSIGDKPL